MDLVALAGVVRALRDRLVVVRVLVDHHATEGEVVSRTTVYLPAPTKEAKP